MSFQLHEIQSDLRPAKLDGWLFYDFRGRDPIAHRILDLPNAMRTRRWFYFVPAKGTPRKLTHKIETESLVTLPGETLYYSGQEELRRNLKKMLGRSKNVAMQYSPKNAIPYVAMVDAGMVELVKSCGVKVVTSADLVQKYEACWTPEQLQSHLLAGKTIDRIVAEAFALAGKGVREKKPLTEARDRAVSLIQSSIAAGKPLQGWQVDKVARSVVEKAGYGKYFIHRTGHNIGQSVHGNGVNMDGLETHDSRRLIPRTCNSVEPGIYLPEFGMRSEVNVYVDEDKAQVTGAVQKEILAL